jgi:uncharacterized protein YndB with AHSA1/START domain
VIGDALIGTVRIEAPPAAVFRAFTDPAQLVQWWGSAEMYWTTEWSCDPRPGGRWASRGSGVSGRDFTVEGIYLEVDPPRRLVYTWNPSWQEIPTTTVEIDLVPDGEGTILYMRHFGFGQNVRARDDHLGGMPSVLMWLRGYLEGTHRSHRVGE